MRKIIVVSTTSDSDSYGSRLAQHFTKGAKEAGMEVEIKYLLVKIFSEKFKI